MLILKKLNSIVKKIIVVTRSQVLKIKYKYFFDNISFGSQFSSGQNLCVSCTDAGKLTVGNNVSIGRNVKIIAQGGNITIGDNSFIGDGAIIASKQSISIGADALIAEYVVIRDQDHGLKNDPINQAGFVTAPIVIENNVWLAAKATVLKGVHIGEGAVVAAHALVNKNVTARNIVAGVPAKQVGSR